MAVVVEPVVTAEKLASLLAEGHEQTGLDYKRQLDLRQKQDLVELTKDVAAMQSEESGGYIVIGADDHGKVVSDLTPEMAKHFDEASLRNQLKQYIAEPFEVRSAQHEVDGCIVVLLYIAPHPDGWCIFLKQGEYEREVPLGSGKKVQVFRQGDVFVRHGSASERWNASDQMRLLKKIVAGRKEEWRSELRMELTGMLNVGLSAQSLEQLPTSAVTWKLDAEGFDQLIIELMRRDDDIPIRKLLLQARPDAASLLTSSESDDLSTLLDRITSVAGLALSYERQQWFNKALDCLVKLYELGFDKSGNDRTDVEAAPYWLDVIVHVYALGGLAVRFQNWPAVKALADRLPEGYDLTSHYGSWLRHALTKASRAEMLEKENLLARARNVARRVEAVRPDVDTDDERILTSLCQFDALGGLVVIGERHQTHRSLFYPSFARYYSQRTVPAFKAIVSNQEMRAQLFAGDDRLLAQALVDIDSIAQHESFRYDGYEGIHDPVVVQFLKDNPPQETQ